MSGRVKNPVRDRRHSKSVSLRATEPPRRPWMPPQAGVTWLLVEPRRQAAGLQASIEEGEDMNTSERGLKHVCPECETKYYDLRRAIVACPRCGAKPLAAKARKTTQPARKAGGTRFGRYPY